MNVMALWKEQMDGFDGVPEMYEEVDRDDRRHAAGSHLLTKKVWPFRLKQSNALWILERYDA